MKNPIYKSNLRRPVKGILFMLLLTIASSAFISSASQLVIINREINRIGSYYTSIGTIQPIDENEYYVNEARNIIYEEPMIDYEDKRRFCQGIIEGLYNPDIRQYESFADYGDYHVFVGDTIFTAQVGQVYKNFSAKTIYDGLGINLTTIKERLAGFPDYAREGFPFGLGATAVSLKTGEKIKYINNDVIDDLLTLEPGKTYLFRGYMDYSIANNSAFIKPLYENGPLYEEVDENASIDWDNPKWKKLREDIDVLNENIQSYSIYTTKDMMNMPITQNSMKDYYLKDGRWINKDDNIEKNYVCVINEDLANLRNVNIGDKLEIQMRNTEKGYGYLATTKDIKEWKTYNTSQAISFEVIGVFALHDAQRMGTRGREIFIPDSTLPEEFGHYYDQGMDEPDYNSFLYSFTLKNSQEEDVFIKKYGKELEELGYRLSFIENNSQGFWASAKPIKQSVLISFILFTIILLLVQVFIIYFYIDGHKLNYAIERALGIPTKTSIYHLVLPLIIFGSMASMVGGLLGHKNALVKSSRLLEDLGGISQATVNRSLDTGYFFPLVLGMNLLLLLIIAIKTSQLKRLSIIELISSHSAKMKKKGDEGENIKEDKNLDFQSLGKINFSSESLLVKGSRNTLVRYSANNIFRSKLSSMLLLTLAGIFVFSLLWMNYAILRNKDLIDRAYNETIIRGNFITNKDRIVTGALKGDISASHIDNLLASGLVKDYSSLAIMSYRDMYVEKNGILEKYEREEKDIAYEKFLNRKPIFNVRASNKPYNGESGMNLTDLNFVDGYSLEDLFKDYKTDYSDKMNPIVVDDRGKEEIPILASEKALEEYELRLGDTIILKEEDRENLTTYATIVGTFFSLDIDEKNEWLNQYVTVFAEEEALFIYPISALEAMEKNRVYYDLLDFEFKPEKNRELLARKEELKKMVANNIYDVNKNELKLWDEELINVVEPLEKNLSLLEILYPITFTFSIIIAGILAFIMAIARAIDVAILRILGVKAREVGWNLFRENLILVLLGIIISCIGILSITTGSYPIALDKYAMVIGGYLLGTIVGLILAIARVTRKKPLEMLQVKE